MGACRAKSGSTPCVSLCHLMETMSARSGRCAALNVVSPVIRELRVQSSGARTDRMAATARVPPARAMQAWRSTPWALPA